MLRVALAFAFSLAGAAALAQGFPSEPVKLIVPYPAEVQALLQSYPAVADSAVVGWPLREFPKEAFVVDEFPRSTLGRVIKAELSTRLSPP